jgi:hypothetical protein
MAQAALSLRQGGVSEAPFSSLNLGHSAGDDPSRVAENEARLSLSLDLPGAPARVRLAHGADLRIVDSAGIYGPYDGLLTCCREVPLWLTVADCLPIYLASGGGEWIGILHCGWRGAAAGCVASMVTEMVEASGSAPSAIRAWIGPGIGSSCYPVGDDVAARFPAESVTRAAETTHLDLGRAAEILLHDAGLPTGSVLRSPLCTACRPDLFFSFRRDGKRSGRMAAVIWIGSGEGRQSD